MPHPFFFQGPSTKKPIFKVVVLNSTERPTPLCCSGLPGNLSDFRSVVYIYIYMYITCYKSYLPLGLVSNILSRSKSSRSGLVFSKAPPTESETISSVTLNHGFPQKRKTCVSHTTHFTSRPSSVSFKHVCLTLIRTC